MPLTSAPRAPPSFLTWIDDISRTLPDVLAQELERARARELRALGVIRAALIAVEAVAGRVDEGLRARVLRRGLLRGVDRDRLIGLAPVEHDRALRFFAGVAGDAAAVVAHGARQAREARRRHPRDRPAPAVADDAD